MSKFEVVATKWSSEHHKQVEVVIGSFDQFYNAKLFSDAYSAHFKSDTKITEYKQVPV